MESDNTTACHGQALPPVVSRDDSHTPAGADGPRAPWPCHLCSLAGVRNVGTRGYCASHLSDLYKLLGSGPVGLSGIAVQSGRLRPEFGNSYADVRCDTCNATWVGVIGSPCAWCARHHQILVLEQRRSLLRIPDTTDERALLAWRSLLQNAVRAGVLDRQEAEGVWLKAVARHA